MMLHEISARLAPGRSIAPDDFADLTTVPVVDVRFAEDGLLVVTFDGDLDEDTATLVRARLTSTGTAEEDLRHKARQARATNDQFVTSIAPQLVAGADQILADPTASTQEHDLARGVKALANQCESLSRQVSELGRIVLQEFNGEQ